MTERSDYTAGLRALADALDDDPALPLPYPGFGTRLAVFTRTAAENAAYVGLLADAAVEYRPDEDTFPHRTTGMLRGLSLLVYGPAVTADEGTPLELDLELIP